MKIIRPTQITDAMLLASSVAEDPLAAWASGTTYSLGQRVSRAATHRVYESLVGANLGNVPETNADKWLDAGPTNRWAMFDAAVGTATAGSTTLTVSLQPGLADSLALLDVSASQAVVTMLDGVGGAEVYRRTVSFESGNEVASWFDWFFEPIVRRTAAILDDLPPYAAGAVSVAFSDGSPVSVGTCVFGRSFEVGDTQRPAKVGIIDYSRRETDAFGATTVVERAYARRMEAQIVLGTALVDEVSRQLSEIRATPVVWIADEAFDALTIYGFVTDWSVDLTYRAPGVSYCSLTVEGMT